MDTLQRIKLEAQAAMTRANAGLKLSPSDVAVLEIYNRLNGGKAGNAGKRRVIRTGK